MSRTTTTQGNVYAHEGAAESCGLRAGVLGPVETLAQSVSAVAPSTTASLTIALVFGLAGNATWLVYLLATGSMLLVGCCVSRFARLSASPGSFYSYAANTLPAVSGVAAAWGLLLAYLATGASSYTFSHATDEQSGMGLFYNGNNPNNLRSDYGSAHFGRTHVLNVTYGYTTPTFLSKATLAGKVLDSWGINGIAIIQSGQPYSIIDYSGAVGSIFYSTFNGITNPIVPLNYAAGRTAKNALTGQNGAFYNPTTQQGAALKADCFTLPLIPVGTMGVPAGDPFETNFTFCQRNIFRQSWQRRADASLVKDFPIHEQYTLRYRFDVYNITNTASFDIPQNNVNQNQAFNNVPDQVGTGYGGYPTQAAPTNNCRSNPYGVNNGFYNCPSALGITRHTIGSPR